MESWSERNPSPAMENVRIERGSVGDHYTSLQRLQKRKKMMKL